MTKTEKRDYVLMRSEKYLTRKWIFINDYEELDDLISSCTFLNIDYFILYNIENKYDYDNDCYYLDKIWKKIFVDYKED